MQAILERNGNHKKDEQEQRLFDSIKRMLTRARGEHMTATATITISLFQGGIVGKRMGIVWDEK